MFNETIPENTRRSTDWEVKVFYGYCARNNIIINLAIISEEELAKFAKRFYSCIRKKDGSLYTPSALVGIRSALHRTITSPPIERSINIMAGNAFIAANRVFTAKCKIYTARGNPKPKHKPQISETDLKKLGSYFSSFATDHRKLQQYVWFGLCYFFGRRGREGWRELRINSFVLKTDEDNTEYLSEGITMKTKNHQGGAKVSENDYSDPRCYNERFITAYKLFVSKRHPEEASFFQAPRLDYDINDDIWYKRAPLGKNKLNNMMQELSTVASLSQVYTAHCIRATSISTLFQAGVSAKQICELTKHKNETSLNSYISGSTSAQKRSCSSILGQAMPIQVSNSILSRIFVHF